MARSAAATVDAYLAALPDDRRAVVSTVRDLVRAHLPEGYREAINWGMIAYEVPLERYPTTYNKQPLSYAALAAQKSYYALYLHGIYSDPGSEDRLRAEFAKAGKRLDMGKSCLRFRAVDDLDLDAIGRVIAGTSVDAFLARYEAARKSR